MTNPYDVDLDYVEPEIVRDAEPHTLKVAATEIRDVESQGMAKKVVDILLRVTDTDLVNPKPVRYSIWLPSDGDTKEQLNATKGKIVRFTKACGQSPASTIGDFINQLPSMVNAEFKAILKVKADEQYGDSNEIKRILV